MDEHEKNLEKLGLALGAIFGPEDEELRYEHRLRTPDCPSLIRLAEGAIRKNWTLQEQQHTGACAYCKMVLAWESKAVDSPPDWDTEGTLTPGGRDSFDESGWEVLVSAELPSLVLAFDTAPPPLPFLLRTELPGEKVTITLNQSPEGNLEVYVTTSEPALAGRKVRVAVIGPKDKLTAEVVLEKWPGHGCDGRHVFGPLGKVTEKLGQQIQLKARLS